jgi:heme/copper-type cytochrome/quinol oxidase subunit 2
VIVLKKILVALLLLAPAKMFACAACYGGAIDAPMADGMNWAILTLGVVITTVLGAFLTFLIYAIRKSEALTAAAEQKTSPQISKV